MTTPAAPASPGTCALPADPSSRRVDELLADLAVAPDRGLTAREAAARLDRFGSNALAAPPQTSALALFASQFRNLLVVILVVAAALASLVGDVKDAAAIAFVLVVNATLGFVQERRAERSVDALRAMLAAHARVRRDGRPHDIAASDVVPGDILLIEAGDRIAADGRLLEATSLAVDESALTGESVPVDKDAAARPAADAPVGEQRNAVHMNTVVTRGRAEVVVTATGMRTMIGRFADLIQTTSRRPTPLQRQLADLGRRLAGVAGAAVGAVFALALVRGDRLGDAAVDAIALAVAAIPEGLPAVVTVTLALGTAQMAKRRAIVKRLSSVETLGSATVVCTDKTGTLTRNEMTVRRVWRAGGEVRVTGDGYTTQGQILPATADRAALRAVAEAGALCNDAAVGDGIVVGDPTEGALVVLAAKAGIDVDAVRAARPRLAQLPFDSTSKLMATLHPAGEHHQLVVKGAPDVLLTRCAGLVGPYGRADLTAADRSAIERVLEEMGAEGLRVLALATRTVPPAAAGGDLAPFVDDLTLEALVGIVDPPRPEAAAAITTCGAAGVRVMMITGDHAATASAVARQVGISGEVLVGADLDGIDNEPLEQRLGGVGVIARVSPAHKLRIVEALQRRGQVVAMTGDGVNDAPALKGADIGVAMGRSGTDVAKDAADLVLADDNFATIVGAIERGRGIYDNIVAFVRFQLATNVGAITAVFAARLLGLPAPFTPLQILWVNLIMDGPPAMALALDPPRSDTMQRPPRDPAAQILGRRRFAPLLLTGAVMATGTLAAYSWGHAVGGTSLATTMAFTTFVLQQFCNALNARVEHGTVFSRHTLRNLRLWLALGGVLALQVAAVHVGVVQRLFDTVALDARQWAAAAGIASTVLLVEELRKGVGRRQEAW